MSIKKAQRAQFARRDTGQPVYGTSTVRGKRPRTGSRRRRLVGTELLKLLRAEFTADCTRCFNAAVSALNKMPVQDVRRDAEIYGAEIWDALQVARDRMKKVWAREMLQAHPRRSDLFFVDLVLQACEVCEADSTA